MTWETSEETITPIRVTVSFKKSSSRDGSEGFDIDVLEGADEEEAERVMALAKKLRQEALDAIKGPSLEEQLEASVNGGKA